MALFNTKNKASKKETTTKKVSTKKTLTVVDADSIAKTPVAKSAKMRGLDISMVLIRPHVTEKASDLYERGVYVFEIHKHANKMHVRQAIEKLYKVEPIKVAVVVGKPKLMKNPRTGRVQTKKTAVKKAMVYLKKGDKIELV
jgi:large subunit ribosomal protein L23